MLLFKLNNYMFTYAYTLTNHKYFQSEIKCLYYNDINRIINKTYSTCISIFTQPLRDGQVTRQLFVTGYKLLYSIKKVS